MSIYDAADNLDPASGLKQRPLLPEGVYPKVMILSRSCQQDKKKPSCRYDKTLVRVIDPGTTGAKPGDEGEVFVQIAGSMFPSYDQDALAFVKKLVGCAFGYDGPTTKTKITGQVLAGSTVGDGKALGGHVISLTVSHNRREGKKTIANYDCDRVMVNGQVEVIPGFGPGPATSAPAGTAPAVAPPPPPPAPSAPAAPAIPPGWAPNPNAPGWYYNTLNPSEPQKQNFA